ncbi:MAG: tetratricopeptide repeat protein [Candidatus Obscuribacter sp.]|nr:tetratricopeptide repeat protein [Candidatus Obscuribacter sp.]
MLKNLLVTSSLLFAILPTLAQAPQGYGFPGRGNASDWSDALPYYNLGNKYLESGRYDEAIDSFHAACARYDQDADFYINLGVAYRKVDDYQSAEQEATSLSINDKDWMTWSNLGNALLKQKNSKKQSLLLTAVSNASRRLKKRPLWKKT